MIIVAPRLTGAIDGGRASVKRRVVFQQTDRVSIEFRIERSRIHHKDTKSTKKGQISEDGILDCNQVLLPIFVSLVPSW